MAIIAALTISMAAQAAIGDLDPTFGTGGKVTTFVGSSNSVANTVAVQADGKIVVAGIPLLTRYNSDGSLDAAFGTNGVVTISGINQGNGVVIQPDGKILVTGHDLSQVCYLPCGALQQQWLAGYQIRHKRDRVHSAL